MNTNSKMGCSPPVFFILLFPFIVKYCFAMLHHVLALEFPDSAWKVLKHMLFF